MQQPQQILQGKKLNKTACSNGQTSCWHCLDFPPVYLCRQKIPKVFWAFPNRKKQNPHTTAASPEIKTTHLTAGCTASPGYRQTNLGKTWALRPLEPPITPVPLSRVAERFQTSDAELCGTRKPQSSFNSLQSYEWSHWQRRSIYTYAVPSRELFLHKGLCFVSEGGVPGWVYS